MNATHQGVGPDLLMVAEVEKDALLKELITTMNKPHPQEVFLYNATANFVTKLNVGTCFLEGLSSGEKFANRY